MPCIYAFRTFYPAQPKLTSDTFEFLLFIEVLSTDAIPFNVNMSAMNLRKSFYLFVLFTSHSFLTLLHIWVRKVKDTPEGGKYHKHVSVLTYTTQKTTFPKERSSKQLVNISLLLPFKIKRRLWFSSSKFIVWMSW